ncbi:MAG: hypothetical protein FJ110_05570 [Deltaproteobacteria bacterium]|nr:hypothetical protein [Deltaproteobacteria bacterium]
MSWESIFKNIANIIQLITMIGPIIDFVEAQFKRFFPDKKMGSLKKQAVTSQVILMTGGDVPVKIVEEMIDGIVDEKNKSGEFTHTNPGTDVSMSGP